MEADAIRGAGAGRYAPLVLSVDHWPDITEPLMILALTGWVDGGGAGAGAITALGEQLERRSTFATIDVTPLADLQQTRPVAHFVDGSRVIDWPQIVLECGHIGGGRSGAGRDLVLVHGPEPSLRWPSVSQTLVDAARHVGVRQAATLGGIPALVSHRRQAVVTASATQRSLAQELAPLRADYAGPTGLQTVVLRALGDAGIAGAGLWVQVPQYVAGSPSPPAVRALLRRVAELYNLAIDLRPLDERSRAYLRRVEAGLDARPDVKEVVEQIDEHQAPPTGDDLVAEIEQYLRSPPGDRDDGDPEAGGDARA